MTEEKNNEGLLLSEMPAELQSKVEKLGLDKDGDGKIDRKELETLVDRCKLRQCYDCPIY